MRMLSAATLILVLSQVLLAQHIAASPTAPTVSVPHVAPASLNAATIAPASHANATPAVPAASANKHGAQSPEKSPKADRISDKARSQPVSAQAAPTTYRAPVVQACPIHKVWDGFACVPDASYGQP
jgi:hypothetical protein